MADPFLAIAYPILGGGHPSHLPAFPGRPVDPGYGIPGPVDPGYGVPEGGTPTHPIAPGGPPVGVWPPPGTPSHPIYIPEPPGMPDQGLPSEPGTIWPPLRPDKPDLDGKVLLLVWVPGNGFRWVVIDTTLKPAHPIAPGGEGAQPKSK